MYYQFRLVNCAANRVDSLQETLFELGALSATLLEDLNAPIYEPLPGTTPYWDDGSMEILFDNYDSANIAQDLLKAAGWQCCAIEEVTSEGWEAITQAAIKPMQFGKKLWVCPSWMNVNESNSNDIIITLNPGLAFGTGNHGTTRMCLEWLETNNIAHQNGIDYGCGSGILAIAALKLGAKHVIAVDLDPQALQATLQNAIQNDVKSKLEITTKLSLPINPVDFIIANILLKPLLALKLDFYAALKPSGKLVMTGILQEQLSEILEYYNDLFEYNSVLKNDGWVLVEMRKKL